MKAKGGLPVRILLVYPKNPETFWSYQAVLRWVGRKAAFPPLGLLTVAAMLPEDWDLRLVDMNVRPVTDDDLLWADHVMLSAMILHRECVHALAARCRNLGCDLIAGGPLFTTGHEDFPDIPHLVLGEAEELMPRLVADLAAGTLAPIYQSCGRPSLARVPPPRLDLIRMRDYVTMSVQFSRGCPFNCEFCDIIIMNGRIPRTKSPEQVVAELEQLRQHRWQGGVFVVDDNFIGNRTRTKALLEAIIRWRRETRSRMVFLTEASINLADDPDLLDLMVRAGFKRVFVGLETPSSQALDECRKFQNRDRDLVEAVHVIQSAGLEVMGGFIIGFDSDKPDIFRRQFEFIQRSAVVTAMVGLLTALPRTALYQRLMREGRIVKDSTGNNTEATLNFRPLLDREFLVNGYRQLMRKLYEPKAYYARVRALLQHQRRAGPRLRLTGRDVMAFLKSLWFLGFRNRGRFAYWRCIGGTLLCRPRRLAQAVEFAVLGHHYRKVARSL